MINTYIQFNGEFFSDREIREAFEESGREYIEMPKTYKRIEFTKDKDTRTFTGYSQKENTYYLAIGNKMSEEEERKFRETKTIDEKNIDIIFNFTKESLETIDKYIAAFEMIKNKLIEVKEND